MTDFSSTTLASAFYNGSAQELHLDFRDGSRYLYSGVTPDLFERLLTAESKGRFFNEHVRGCFPFRRLPET